MKYVIDYLSDYFHIVMVIQNNFNSDLICKHLVRYGFSFDLIYNFDIMNKAFNFVNMKNIVIDLKMEKIKKIILISELGEY